MINPDPEQDEDESYRFYLVYPGIVIQQTISAI